MMMYASKEQGVHGLAKVAGGKSAFLSVHSGAVAGRIGRERRHGRSRPPDQGKP